MIRKFNMAVMALLLVCAAVCVASGDEERRREFQAIASQLDPGGELFLVLSAGRWIDRMLLALAAGRDGLPAAEPGEQDVRDGIERWRRFMNVHGISGFRGIGSSSVARADGRHAFKFFLLRDAVDSNLPFWRGFFGWQPRRLSSLDFVPAGFGMVRAGIVEPASLWRVLSDGAKETALPETRSRFDTMREALTRWFGMEPETLFASLRDEFLVAVRFEKETAVELPVGGGGTVSVPAPSFLLVVGTGEDLLRGVVEAQLARRKIALVESAVAGEQMRSAQEPLSGTPVPLQPAFASPPGFFILGSSPAVVEEALLAYRHRNGLITRPVFKDAFQGGSMVNSGVLYIDDEAARIVKHWIEGRSGAVTDGAELSLPSLRIRKALTVLGGDLPSCALTVQNWRHGVMLMGSTGIGGEALIRRTGAAAINLWNNLPGGAEALTPAHER